MRARGTRIVCLVGVVVGLCLAWPSAAQVSKPGPLELPDAAKDALHEKWPDWQLAPLDPEADSCAKDDVPSLPLAQADFNGDGIADYGATIRTSAGVRLVVLLYRPWGYDVSDLDALGDQSANRMLSVTRRGTKFTNPLLKFDDYLVNDTLTLMACSGERTFYRWIGTGFDKLVLPPSAPRF